MDAVKSNLNFGTKIVYGKSFAEKLGKNPDAYTKILEEAETDGHNKHKITVTAKKNSILDSVDLIMYSQNGRNPRESHFISQEARKNIAKLTPDELLDLVKQGIDKVTNYMIGEDLVNESHRSPWVKKLAKLPKSCLNFLKRA